MDIYGSCMSHVCISLALMTQGGVVKINHNAGLVVTPTVSIHMIRPCHAMSCHVSNLVSRISCHVSSHVSCPVLSRSHVICLVSCLVVSCSCRVASFRVESSRVVSYHISYHIIYHIISYHIISYHIIYHISYQTTILQYLRSGCTNTYV